MSRNIALTGSMPINTSSMAVVLAGEAKGWKGTAGRSVIASESADAEPDGCSGAAEFVPVKCTVLHAHVLRLIDCHPFNFLPLPRLLSWMGF